MSMGVKLKNRKVNLFAINLFCDMKFGFSVTHRCRHFIFIFGENFHVLLLRDVVK